MTSKTFGDALREARKEARLSADKLAGNSGLSTAYVRDLEKGRRMPSADAVRRLAAAMGVRADALLQAAMGERSSVVLDASATEWRRSVAHRLAIAWDLLTDSELQHLDQVLDSMRLPEPRATGGR